MRSNENYGRSTKRKYLRKINIATASDLVNRNFGRVGPDQLWFIDITEHLTGKISSTVLASWILTHAKSRAGQLIPIGRASWSAISLIWRSTIDYDDQHLHIPTTEANSFLGPLTAELIAYMGNIGDNYDNAPVESFWGKIQIEQLKTKNWNTRAELASAIFNDIEIFHYRQRRHSSLGYLIEVEYESLNSQATSVA